jgi:ABC-type branched-subunit amino acid transport system permease subunit
MQALTPMPLVLVAVYAIVYMIVGGQWRFVGPILGAVVDDPC